MDAGVNTDSRPTTCETGTQHTQAVGTSRDAATIATPAANAAAAATAEALLARIAELETRNRALLAANRKLLQRDNTTGSQQSHAMPRTQSSTQGLWNAPETPFGLMLARKYREESPWRHQCFRMIAEWTNKNHRLQDTLGQLRESNARLAAKNVELMDRNEEMRQALGGLQRANQAGSEVLRAERDKIGMLLADNQRLRNMFAAQRDHIMTLSKKAQRVLELTTPGAPNLQFAMGGANQQAHQQKPRQHAHQQELHQQARQQEPRQHAPQQAPTLNGGGGTPHMAPPVEPSPQISGAWGGAVQQERQAAAGASQHQRTSSSSATPQSRTTSVTSTPQIRSAMETITQAAKQPRPHPAAAPATAPQAGKRGRRGKRGASAPGPPPLQPQAMLRPADSQYAHQLQAPSPRHEDSQRLSLPLQQSLLRDAVVQQAPSPATLVPPKPTATLAPSSAAQTPLAAATPLNGLPNVAQELGTSMDIQAHRGRVIQELGFLKPERRHAVLQRIPPDNIEMIFQTMTPLERHQFCQTFFPAPD